MVVNIYSEAAAISVLVKVYSVRCHATGHSNVMFALQSCTDSLQVLAVPSGETFPASSDGACNFSDIKVEEDKTVTEEGFMAFNESTAIHIKQEEIFEDKTFPDIKSEPDEVSYVCVCLLLDTIYLCPEMSIF
jgi:hypothetical protein